MRRPGGRSRSTTLRRNSPSRAKLPRESCGPRFERVVSTDQLHLTVKFLGDTEEGLVPEIVTAIREACADIQPFPITVRGAGAFPSLSRMNVVWVGVEGAEPIGRIAADVEASLESLG